MVYIDRLLLEKCSVVNKPVDLPSAQFCLLFFSVYHILCIIMLVIITCRTVRYSVLFNGQLFFVSFWTCTAMLIVKYTWTRVLFTICLCCRDCNCCHFKALCSASMLVLYMFRINKICCLTNFIDFGGHWWPRRMAAEEVWFSHWWSASFQCRNRNLLLRRCFI